MTGVPFQNMSFWLARGTFGAIQGAEFFGSPTTCKVYSCAPRKYPNAKFSLRSRTSAGQSGGFLSKFLNTEGVQKSLCHPGIIEVAHYPMTIAS